MARLFRAIAICLILVCGSTSVALAQSDPCKAIKSGIQANEVGGLPLGYSAANCKWEPTLSYTCVIYVCPTPSAATEVQSRCPNCGRPIGLSTGNIYIEETDVRIPGLSGGLMLNRTWNSLWPATQSASQIGMFGMNWRSTYEERIFMGSDNFVKYSRNDGSFWSFEGGGSLNVIAPSNVTATMTANAQATQWTLAFQNGEQRIFNATSGSLTAIVDRNGNTTQLSYDGLNRLVTVVDPGGRHLYFNYGSNSSYLVTSVTSDFGISLSYTYDSNSRLTQVTYPDQTTLSFAFDSNSMITTVTDANGKVLESHTYDACGRGLSSSRAGGVESVGVSYSQPCMTPPSNVVRYFE